MNDEFKMSRRIYGWLLVLEGKRKQSPFSSYQKKFSESSWSSELFTLDKVEDKRWHYRPGDQEVSGRSRVVGYFLSQRQGDFDDETANPFQQDGNGSHLRKNGRVFVAPDFRFVKDVKILLGGGVGSFGG